jgi:hypothetical protein
MFFATAIILGLGIPLVRARVRQMDARPRREELGAGVGERLERIEHAVDAIAVEVERIAEGQRFVTRLLSERPVERALPETGSRLT